MRKLKILFLLFIPVLPIFSQDFAGKVVDTITGEPLPFVTIKLLNSSTGCTSDINGDFLLNYSEKQNEVQAIFSYVGYVSDTLTLNRNVFAEIKLTEDNQLRELVVDGSFNPALPILKKVIEHRKENDPEKNLNYSYQTYNKMFMFANTSDADRSDTNMINPLKFLESQHLLLIETIEQNHHKKPSKDESVILASRTSGLMSTMIPMVATELQSFSFYPNTIKLGDNYFISPISAEGSGVYNYELMDKIVENTDTVFTIRFVPKISSNAEALEGSIQITSDNYALKSVIAKPKVLKQFMQMTINQLYAKRNEHWMPYQLNTSFTMENITANGVKFEGRSYSYIDSVSFYGDVPKNWFSPFEVVIDKDAASHEVLDSLRPMPLTHLDSLTYHVIDSLGKATHLDRKMESANSWLKGRIPLGKLDLDFSRGFNYSEYEGFRLGAGLYTNQKLMKRLTLGGYFAYGFKDKQWKYGASGEVKLVPKYDVNLNLEYQKDIFITASTNVGKSGNLLDPDQYYRIYTNRYNGVKKVKSDITFRYKSLTGKLTGTIQDIDTKFNYAYVLSKDEFTTVSTSNYYLQTIGGEFIYQPKTKLMFDGNKVVSLGSTFPVFSLSIERTLPASSIQFTRLLGKVTGKFRIPHFGKTNFTLHGGWVNSTTALPFLFYQKSTGKNWAVSVFESFETAPIYQFLSSQFCSFFVDQNFGKFLDKGMLQPEFVLYTGLGWGNKLSSENHLYTNFSTYEKGYYESGIKLINLLKSGFSGVGIGGFYRYGYYASANPKDNFVAKVTLNIGL